ncbi:Pr6Pr family membrane protein [Microbacterium sp. Kw_RZR3]|uniref:Pr6Pr family membrane protein n=1 Tax=Microbacterium sp. Kw_RZR3 TaxID=3032903 RepID=UPI0023DB9ADC|nr:Pr6Pr family membrane protein [Microbacterium sp. Kw_RZR3]MDF2048105.1 Pr6Pr family membrane protein [Microbacterium sp. Kw_RZR3]
MTSRRARAITRLVAAAIALIVVLIAYGLRFAVGDGNPFDFFGYFTNQTSSLTALVLIAVALHQLRGGRVPEALAVAWGVGTACLVVVAIVYNTLVPGTGSAPPWVSAILHIVFPVFVVVDFASAPDRPRLRWRALWWVLPYPCLWLAVVLVRGQTDGWVPYGFLLPERGPVSLAAHVIGILALLMLAAAGVWGLSRWRVRPDPPVGASRS